jgi:hypothetical protein
VNDVDGSEWSPHLPHLPLLGRLGSYLYTLSEPWGVLHLVLHKILLGSEANLVSIKSGSSRFSCYTTHPCQCHTSHARISNNANSVSRLCGTKLSSTLVFIAFLGNENKIPKTASEDNLSDFRLVYTVGISGGIYPSSLIRIGISICSNRSPQQGPQLWYSTFFF